MAVVCNAEDFIPHLLSLGRVLPAAHTLQGTLQVSGAFVPLEPSAAPVLCPPAAIRCSAAVSTCSRWERSRGFAVQSGNLANNIQPCPARTEWRGRQPRGAASSTSTSGPGSDAHFDVPTPPQPSPSRSCLAPSLVVAAYSPARPTALRLLLTGAAAVALSSGSASALGAAAAAAQEPSAAVWWAAALLAAAATLALLGPTAAHLGSRLARGWTAVAAVRWASSPLLTKCGWFL